MFHHARRCLKINGELYIVANRHLDYFHKLKKIFGNCTTIATNNKFVVLKDSEAGGVVGKIGSYLPDAALTPYPAYVQHVTPSAG
ncbi:methyltransferase [Escherichia coli]|nr:methyltransferase [Escherichia coli]